MKWSFEPPTWNTWQSSDGHVVVLHPFTGRVIELLYHHHGQEQLYDVEHDSFRILKRVKELGKRWNLVAHEGDWILASRPMSKKEKESFKINFLSSMHGFPVKQRVARLFRASLVNL